MTVNIETTTLKEAVKAAQKKGYEYITMIGLNTRNIEDFLDEFMQDADADESDEYVHINDIIFRVSDIGRDDAELYELG